MNKFISKPQLLKHLALHSHLMSFEPYTSSTYRILVPLDYIRTLTTTYPYLLKYCLVTSDLYLDVTSNYPELFI